ncbi:MAG: AmmeMemoRadiSam system protein B [Campylobacterota bacterium]|nr:AmmeMemoRadiSam system protein B [Campylobacterota bacterium]
MENKTIRKLAVSGQFYPDTIDELNRYIEHFNNMIDTNNILINDKIEPKAIIVPHAGYIYSGFTANIAYRYLSKKAKNIIVIGPSHKYAFEGASVALYDSYPTPIGNLDINKELSQELISKYNFLEFNDTVHCEHSTEVQFPFIKHYTTDVKVVEIVYSSIDFSSLSEMIYNLLQDDDNFVVISTDLSHFYPLNNAHKLDNICLEAIKNKDIESFDKGCEACGLIGVKAIIDVANKLNYKSEILDYRTSADFSNDTNSVVGYTSVVFGG